MVHLQQRRLTSLALGMGMDSSNIMKCWQIANQNNGSHAKAEVGIAVCVKVPGLSDISAIQDHAIFWYYHF